MFAGLGYEFDVLCKMLPSYTMGTESIQPRRIERDEKLTTRTLTECDNDSCISASLVVFAKEISDNTLTLSFCGHHGNKNYVELTRSGWVVIVDDRTFRIEDPRGEGEADGGPEPLPDSTVYPEGTEDDPGTGPVPARS
jgi:hypothetical protein